jgi:vancomycin aglycone glucosyltransferase
VNSISSVLRIEQTVGFARIRVKRACSLNGLGPLKVLISSIGSRGDVQPIIALALELRARGHEARLCVAPNFKEWVESFGLTCLPIGPDLRQLTRGKASKNPLKPSEEQLRQLAVYTIRAQFPTLMASAQGCDLIVAAGALQLATRSVAQSLKIPYVFAAYCPAVLGLEPVANVQHHIFTEQPWLASDRWLAPAGSPTQLEITQAGAWVLSDQRPLPDHVEDFLSSGEPPVYFGFGSMRGTEGASRSFTEAARALGLRSIISQGWGNLRPIDTMSDCLAVDHGGAGTTMAAARAGKPQVIVPHLYDQFFWAHRAQVLRIGASVPTRTDLTADAMTAALREVTGQSVTGQAQTLASRLELQGAIIAAEKLVREFS